MVCLRRAAQVATLETRPAKDHIDVERLSVRWQQRAAHLGFGPQQVAALVQRRRPEWQVNLPALAARLLGPEGLTAHASTFHRRDVLQAICHQLRDGASVEQVQRLVDALLGAETSPVIDLDGPYGVLRRLAAKADDEHRYTTAELLITEQRLIDGALARLDAGVATVPHAPLQAALRSRPLSSEQAAMVDRLVTSGAGVEVVVGKAGSGKTFALAAARQAWEAAGVPVVGCALSARAALELQLGSGIRSMTLHRLLADLDHPKQGGLAPGSVVVIDEAAMVGTRMLARLLEHAARADAKVVLVGDHHQLPEIDAGGAFAALTTRLPAIQLTDNRRQVEAWERDALDQLRQGDANTALDAYRHHDRIHIGETAEQLREQLVGDWYQAVAEHGHDAVMVARRRSDVADLNRRARQRMAATGELHGPVLEAAGRPFQAGDQAVCLHNDHWHGVTNGTRGTVLAVHPQRQSLDFLPDGASNVLTLGPSYLDRGWLDHGYAITAHKAQGLTCDATFVLADEGL